MICLLLPAPLRRRSDLLLAGFDRRGHRWLTGSLRCVDRRSLRGLGSDHGSDIHSARHLGSFSIALAVGFLYVAWRPARVSGLVPVVAALVACVLGTSLLDLMEGHTAVVSEVSHMVEVVGLVTVWLLGHEGFSRRARVIAA